MHIRKDISTHSPRMIACAGSVVEIFILIKKSRTGNTFSKRSSYTYRVVVERIYMKMPKFLSRLIWLPPSPPQRFLTSMYIFLVSVAGSACLWELTEEGFGR